MTKINLIINLNKKPWFVLRTFSKFIKRIVSADFLGHAIGFRKVPELLKFRYSLRFNGTK